MRLHATAEQTETFDQAWESFVTALKRARGRAEPDRSGGITLSQYHLLRPLCARGAASPVGALAAEAGVTTPTATRMLKALGADGLVERAADDEDGRVVLVALTPAGREAMAVKRRFVAARRRRISEALSPEERDQAGRLLARLAHVIDEL